MTAIQSIKSAYSFCIGHMNYVKLKVYSHDPFSTVGRVTENEKHHQICGDYWPSGSSGWKGTNAARMAVIGDDDAHAPRGKEGYDHG